MSNIFVTNNSDQDLKDGFGGVFYEFKQGSTVEIPEEVARHVFGYGDDSKQVYLARLGWAKTNNDLQEGLDRLAKWDLSTEPPRKNQSLSPLVERVPFPSQKKGGGKVLSVAA
jgi:hypothetical protein